MTRSVQIPTQSASDGAVLRLRNIRKTYPGVVALDDVSLDVRRGEVHAVVGENGAGKSTLIGVAAGSIIADAGSIEIAGRAMQNPEPRVMREAGIAVVYQRPAVLPDLTVAENLALAVPPSLAPSAPATHSWASEHLAAVSSSIDVRRRVVELTAEERHLVEISKALANNPHVLILDEPTEPLDRSGIEALFDRIAEIAKRGTAIVYISHRLPEVKRIADRITVLRDGRHRGTLNADDVSEDDVLRLIVGRDVHTAFPEKAAIAADAPETFRVAGLSHTSFFSDVSFSARRGEIVGIGGVAGNGQREIIQALAGLTRSRGDVFVAGERIRHTSPTRVVAAGITYLPGDRHEEGVFATLSVRENVSIAALGSYSKLGIVRERSEARAVDAEIEHLAIRTPSPEAPIALLSGGNQQKAVIARALLQQPKVILAEEPTQGVDVATRLEIYRMLRAAAESGAAVIVLSSDAMELEGLCDRVLVVSRGRIVHEFAGADVTEDAITKAAVMSTSVRETVTHRGLGNAGRFVIGDYLPSAVLVLAIAAFAAYTTGVNERFLSSANLTGLLFLVSALVFVSLAQQVVMLVGGIDLSVGPATGFVVIIGSFLLVDPSTVEVALGLIAMLAVAVAIGGTNAMLVRYVQMSAVVATLVTFTILQGLSLLLRPQPGGFIDTDVLDWLNTSVASVPVLFIAAALTAVGLECALRWTRWGLELRAVGSRAEAAHALGIRVDRVRALAFITAGLLVGLGGISLMAQTGVGDPLAGTAYTLSSITAVVLGGASIFGGRGSFIGTLLGALLLQELVNATVFLGINDAWQYWLVGLMALVAAGTYSKLRSVVVIRAGGAPT